MNPCTACPLHETALTVCIGGRGAEQAQILIVGQSPGREEDLAGEAFVGKAGKLLDAMLRDAGFDPAVDVRISYAVRCVTPENRVPLPSEVSACSPHLLDEIAAMKPRAIIAMGETALKALVGNKAISGARGKSFPLHARFAHECEVFVTYAPGYVLKSPMARATVVSDLRRVRDSGLEQSVQTWQAYVGQWPFAPDAPIAYDIETYDRDGAITENATEIAVSDGERAIVSINRIGDVIEALRAHRGPVVSHNGWKFDDEKTGVQSRYDTMALGYLVDETQPLNLEALCVKYLGVRGWKEARDGAKLGTKELAGYNARDAAYTLRLFLKLSEMLGERLRIIDHVIRPAQLALAKATERGIYIDPEQVQKAKVATQALIDERHARVIEEVAKSGFPSGAFDKQLKTKVKQIPFNPNSNDHVAKVFLWLGFSLPKTKDDKWSVDKNTLVYMDHPLAEAVLDYREAAKRKSTYIDPYERFTQSEDGRAHSIFEVIKTATGRSSSHGADSGKWKGRGTNTQNLDRELKKFKTAAPGKVLVSADYAAVEFRMGAFIANERVIIENYTRDPNWDPHTFFAARLYHTLETIVKAEHAESPNNSKRQIAKSANFSQEYLGTGETLRSYAAREMSMFLSRQESQDAHNGWHRTFPGWKRWYVRTKQEWLDNYRRTGIGYVEDPIGWRRNYGDLSLLTGKQKADALRELCNFKVQGFCARIAYIALGACDRAGLPIVDFVHDDIKFEFDSIEQAEQAKPLIRRCMVDEPLRVLREVFGVVPTVPLEIDVQVNENPANQQLPGEQQKAHALAA